MCEDREASGLLVEACWLSSRCCVPAIDDASFGDYGKECFGEEEARRQVRPGCGQLGRHFVQVGW